MLLPNLYNASSTSSAAPTREVHTAMTSHRRHDDGGIDTFSPLGSARVAREQFPGTPGTTHHPGILRARRFRHRHTVGIMGP